MHECVIPDARSASQAAAEMAVVKHYLPLLYAVKYVRVKMQLLGLLAPYEPCCSRHARPLHRWQCLRAHTS